MRLTRAELIFIALGAGLGVAVAATLQAGWVAPSASFPPFVLVLFGLGLSEIVAGFAMGRSPGSLIGMPARIAAFALGIGVLMLLRGGLA